MARVTLRTATWSPKETCTPSRVTAGGVAELGCPWVSADAAVLAAACCSAIRVRGSARAKASPDISAGPPGDAPRRDLSRNAEQQNKGEQHQIGRASCRE